MHEGIDWAKYYQCAEQLIVFVPGQSVSNTRGQILMCCALEEENQSLPSFAHNRMSSARLAEHVRKGRTCMSFGTYGIWLKAHATFQMRFFLVRHDQPTPRLIHSRIRDSQRTGTCFDLNSKKNMRQKWPRLTTTNATKSWACNIPAPALDQEWRSHRSECVSEWLPTSETSRFPALLFNAFNPNCG